MLGGVGEGAGEADFTKQSRTTNFARNAKIFKYWVFLLL